MKRALLFLALLSAFLALPTACRPDQLQAAIGGVQIAGVVCDLAADKAGEPILEYVCDALDVVPAVLSAIPVSSASAPPPGARSGPPMPAQAKARFRVTVAREARKDFEAKHGRK